MTEIIKMIKQDESSYEAALGRIAARVCGDDGIRLVLIAGGSCAGKTTSTKKLAGLINRNGRKAYSVSLDDFYRNNDEAVYLPDGTRDIETLNSLRVDLIQECIKNLAEGRETPVPVFDFKTETRTDDHRRIKLQKGDVVLVEGLHALNPVLYHDLAENAFYRVFLFAESHDGSDCRLVRRMVRDSRHRNADAERTFSLWENVKRNEYASIDPFKKFADVSINTFFPYERGVLDDDAVHLLNAVSETSRFKQKAIKLAEILSGTERIADSLVPVDSLLQEFM